MLWGREVEGGGGRRRLTAGRGQGFHVTQPNLYEAIRIRHIMEYPRISRENEQPMRARAASLLILFRLAQGISFGAEFGTASTWVVEQAALPAEFACLTEGGQLKVPSL